MFINMTNDPGKYHLACPDWSTFNYVKTFTYVYLSVTCSHY